MSIPPFLLGYAFSDTASEVNKMKCGNCLAEKEDDGFRACPRCREMWRKQQRKPGGYKHQIEMLEEKVARLEAEICVLRQTG